MVGLRLFSVCIKNIMKDLASQVTIKVLGTSRKVFLPCICSTVLFLAMFCIPQTEFLYYVYNVLCCHMQNLRYFHLHYTEHLGNGQDRL